MASALKDSRRFRRHTVVLPPEARALGPLDVVAWTSVRNGYEDKLFTDRPRRGPAVGLRRASRSARSTPPTTTSPRTTSCRPRSAFSAGRRGCRSRSTSRRGRRACPTPPAPAGGPAIRLDWNPETRAEGVRWQYRLLALAGPGAARRRRRLLRRRPGLGRPRGLRRRAARGLRGRRRCRSASPPDVAAGTTLIAAGILPASEYQVRLATPAAAGALDRGRDPGHPADRGSTSTPRSTSRIDTRRPTPTPPRPTPPPRSRWPRTRSTRWRRWPATPSPTSRRCSPSSAASTPATSSPRGSWRSPRCRPAGTPIRPSSSGARAASRSGSTAGSAGHRRAVRRHLRRRPGARRRRRRDPAVDRPIASSDVAGQMPAADPEAEWLVLFALVTFTAGSADALRLRAEWLADGASVWTRGDMLGLTAPQGTLHPAWHHAPGPACSRASRCW